MISWNQTVPFVVPLKQGTVIKVYDGDTITVASTLPFDGCSDVFRFPVRLRGVDAPEIRGKTDDERQAARISRDALRAKLLNQVVTLSDISTEKFGRLLANVSLGDVSINTWLVENRFAIRYYGRKKTQPESWLQYMSRHAD